MEVLETETVSPTTVYNQLRAQDELNERQRRTLEHLEKHLAVKDEDTFDELYDELEALDAFKEDHIVKLIELLPETAQEVRTLFAKERIKLDDADVEDVLQFTSSVRAG